MTKGVATLVLRRRRGKLVVQGLGQTPRGQKFIRKQEELSVSKIGDKEFKAELARAVEQILG